MIFEWMNDPAAWMGLATLVVMELILGIDNILFIAILAQKLPPHQRDKARQIGLSLALGMRILLLCSLSWMASLTEPLMTAMGKEFSGRDLILLVGGFFLLFKATLEIHSRLEGNSHKPSKSGYKANFWMVIAQIIILDAVFSLDAVITAVGMTEHLSIMIIAVTISIGLMILLSKPLAIFINAHPTLVILCLGFLLMVGFSLIAEGFGLHIPKGYLYAAIGFSIMVEAINQFANARFRKRVIDAPDMRERTADMILRALGARQDDHSQTSHEIGAVMQLASKHDLLAPAEKELLRGVLNLTERPVNTVMTPRTDIEWLDSSESPEGLRRQLAESKRSQLLVGDGTLEDFLGVVSREDFLASLLRDGTLPPLATLLVEPIFVHENIPVLNLLETFKKRISDLAVVIDEFGSIQGIITHHDLLEAIAGEFPDHDDPKPQNDILAQADGSFIINGMASIYDVRDRAGLDYLPDGSFATMAGFVIHEFTRIPAVGEKLPWNGWVIEIMGLEGKRISKVRIYRVNE